MATRAKKNEKLQKKVYQVKLGNGVDADLCIAHIAKFESEGGFLERENLVVFNCLVCECDHGNGDLRPFIDGYIKDCLEWRKAGAAIANSPRASSQGGRQ